MRRLTPDFEEFAVDAVGEFDSAPLFGKFGAGQRDERLLVRTANDGVARSGVESAHRHLARRLDGVLAEDGTNALDTRIVVKRA